MIDRIDAYVLKELELLCLATCMKMEKIYGYIYSVKNKENFAKDIHYALYGLAKKEYISIVDNKNIRLCAEIKEIMEIIKFSNQVLEIKKNSTKETLIIYVTSGEEVVIMRQSVTNEEDVILFKIPRNNIIDCLKDEGILEDIEIEESFIKVVENGETKLLTKENIKEILK